MQKRLNWELVHNWSAFIVMVIEMGFYIMMCVVEDDVSLDYNFIAASNDALDSFDTIGNHINEQIRDFVKHYLTENIIYNHYSEAMRKYSQNGIPTQKLSI